MPRKFLLVLLTSTWALGPVASAQSDNREDRIVVNVWAGPEGAVLSRNFATSALKAAAQIRDWQRDLAYTFRIHYPLSEDWIAEDRDRAAEALQLATAAAKGDADEAALGELVTLFESMRSWCDARVKDNRNLELGNYYMSSSALDNDEVFQDALTCSKSLTSMLAKRRFVEETACH